LGEYFHPEAVIVAPGFRKRAQGRDECMQSYKDFVAATKVTDYQESDMTVDIWGDTAVASYHYEIAWEVKGQPYRDSGRDVFVLRREGGKWLVVWRTLVPPAGQGGTGLEVLKSRRHSSPAATAGEPLNPGRPNCRRGQV